MSNILVPDSVVQIDSNAFSDCYRLTQIGIPNNVQSIGSHAFFGCRSLTSVVIPDSVSAIGSGAFQHCNGLKSIIIGAGVTNIGANQFSKSVALKEVTFLGNAPVGVNVFDPLATVQVFYRPGTSGWGASIFGAPTAFLVEASPSILKDSLGYSTNASVIVEARTLGTASQWIPIVTNTISYDASSTDASNGWFQFLDTRSIAAPQQFYRLRW
jgi:hypothetical protein